MREIFKGNGPLLDLKELNQINKSQQIFLGKKGKIYLLMQVK